MILRGATKCCRSVRPVISRQTSQYAQYAQQCRRGYSIPASATPAGASTSSGGMLAPFTNELDRLTPSFKINGSQIQIIRSPTDFYETLKVLTPFDQPSHLGVQTHVTDADPGIYSPRYAMRRAAYSCQRYISANQRKSWQASHRLGPL
jgi:hypothetical protein